MQTAAVSSNGQIGSGAAARGLASMKSEDFFKILVTEMQQQDPFEPTKTADMISQVSQIRDIELNGQLTESLSGLSQSQRTVGASDFIGRHVTANVPLGDGTSAELRGLVTGVRFNPDGAAVLELDTGETVLATQVTRVTTADGAQQQVSAPVTGANAGSAASATANDPAKSSAAKLKFPWLEGVFRL